MTNSSKNIIKAWTFSNGEHKKSQILLTRFLNEYWGKYVPINKVFDSKHKENIKKAREAITPIVYILKLCGRQNIPLRS